MWVKLDNIKAWYEAELKREEDRGWTSDSSTPGWKERVYIGFLLDYIEKLERKLK